MTISGEELGVDLYELRRAGLVILPELAAFYAQASRHAHNSSWHEREGFEQEWRAEYEPNRPDPTDIRLPWNVDDLESLGHTATITEETFLSPLFQPWTQIRNLLQTYLAMTANRVVVAGLALDQIAAAYARTDEAAADRLREESVDLDYDIPEVPDVRLPGDPHQVVVEPQIEVEVGSGPLGIPIPELEIVPVEVPQEEPINPVDGD